MKRPRFYNKKRRYQRKKGRFKQGFFKPINEEKYIKPFDKTMNKIQYPEYRSSWELAFYKYLDNSKEVEYWSTEYLAIHYLSPKDNQYHRYYPDIFLKTKTGDKYIIEIKPHNQVNNPINKSKFKAAEAYASTHGFIFKVFTEKELKAYNVI